MNAHPLQYLLRRANSLSFSFTIIMNYHKPKFDAHLIITHYWIIIPRNDPCKTINLDDH